jgi:hypothetical protein
MKMFCQNRTCLLKWLSIAYILLAFAGMGQAAGGGEQEVSLMPETVSIVPGEQVEIRLSYDVVEGEVKTTGIGLRIHYNSRAIADLTLKDVYGESLIGMDSAARDDADDLDNDPLTDKFLSVAWIGVSGNWPMFLEVPAVLGTIVFKAKAQDEVKITTLNVTASGTPAGYNFHGKGARIILP